MTLHLPTGGPAVTTYYKYGPTLSDPNPHWYEFDGLTGALINPNSITLGFIDGQRGDNDLLANGTIVDPSGPGISTFSTFSAFSVNPLRINQRLKTFFLLSNFTLGQGSDGINLEGNNGDPVTFTIANFTTTIPPGSFRKGHFGVYAYAGKINNVSIEVLIAPLGNKRFGFQAAAYGANLTGTTNLVTVGLRIGNDSGETSVNAIIR